FRSGRARVRRSSSRRAPRTIADLPAVGRDRTPRRDARSWPTGVSRHGFLLRTLPPGLPARAPRGARAGGGSRRDRTAARSRVRPRHDRGPARRARRRGARRGQRAGDARRAPAICAPECRRARGERRGRRALMGFVPARDDRPGAALVRRRARAGPPRGADARGGAARRVARRERGALDGARDRARGSGRAAADARARRALRAGAGPVAVHGRRGASGGRRSDVDDRRADRLRVLDVVRLARARRRAPRRVRGGPARAAAAALPRTDARVGAARAAAAVTEWRALAASKQERFEAPHGALDERALLRLGNTAYAAALALRMDGSREAIAWFRRA